MGGRRLLHEAFCNLTGLRIPLDAAGSFDPLAWQLLWIAGLWAGTRYAQSAARRYAASASIIGVALAIAIVFFVWRHRVGGIRIELGQYSFLLDKWHLGFLRLVNFASLALVVSHAVLPLFAWVRVSMLSLLGRASLQAFSVHVLLCVGSLGLIIDDDTPLNSAEEALVLVLTLSVMFWVAWKSAGGRAIRR